MAHRIRIETRIGRHTSIGNQTFLQRNDSGVDPKHLIYCIHCWVIIYLECVEGGIPPNRETQLGEITYPAVTVSGPGKGPKTKGRSSGDKPHLQGGPSDPGKGSLEVGAGIPGKGISREVPDNRARIIRWQYLGASQVPVVRANGSVCACNVVCCFRHCHRSLILLESKYQHRDIVIHMHGRMRENMRGYSMDIAIISESAYECTQIQQIL